MESIKNQALPVSQIRAGQAQASWQGIKVIQQLILGWALNMITQQESGCPAGWFIKPQRKILRAESLAHPSPSSLHPISSKASPWAGRHVGWTLHCRSEPLLTHRSQGQAELPWALVPGGGLMFTLEQAALHGDFLLLLSKAPPAAALASLRLQLSIFFWLLLCLPVCLSVSFSLMSRDKFNPKLWFWSKHMLRFQNYFYATNFFPMYSLKSLFFSKNNAFPYTVWNKTQNTNSKHTRAHTWCAYSQCTYVHMNTYAHTH